jgi:DNA-binding transcriptional regulator YdaS (Cro superfamily)
LKAAGTESNPEQPHQHSYRSQAADPPRRGVFISYSQEDYEFANQFKAALTTSGIDCALDGEGISGGEDWKHRLGVQIAEADTVVFALSVICRTLGEARPPESLQAINHVIFYHDSKRRGSAFGEGLKPMVEALNHGLTGLLDSRSQDVLVRRRAQELLVNNPARNVDQTKASRHHGPSAFTPEEALQEAIRRAGGQGALARKLGIKQQAVTQWRIAPATRALPIERLTGIRREDLRPDVFDFVVRDVSRGIVVGDYEGGFVTDKEVRKQVESYRDLISKKIRLLQADELEQAREFLASGQPAAAAVVAGVVLETALRKLCGDKGIPVGKLEKINADLANAGVYDERMQRRVTMLAEIRNKAAHGDTAGFSDADVRGMVTDVERFVSDFPVA